MYQNQSPYCFLCHTYSANLTPKCTPKWTRFWSLSWYLARPYLALFSKMHMCSKVACSCGTKYTCFIPPPVAKYAVSWMSTVEEMPWMTCRYPSPRDCETVSPAVRTKRDSLPVMNPHMYLKRSWKWDILHVSLTNALSRYYPKVRTPISPIYTQDRMPLYWSISSHLL